MLTGQRELDLVTYPRPFLKAHQICLEDPTPMSPICLILDLTWDVKLGENIRPQLARSEIMQI